MQMFTASSWLVKQHIVQPLFVCQLWSDSFPQIIPKLDSEGTKIRLLECLFSPSRSTCWASDTEGKKPSDYKLLWGEWRASGLVVARWGHLYPRSWACLCLLGLRNRTCGRLMVWCPWRDERGLEGELRPFSSWKGGISAGGQRHTFRNR